MNDMRIYQSEAGYNGQKMVTGTSGTGTVSRTINVQVYGGFGDGYNEDNGQRMGRLPEQALPLQRSYHSIRAERPVRQELQSGLRLLGELLQISDLVKDTTVLQDNQTSVYNIHTEVEGTAHVGARVQKGARAVPIYSMSGTYSGYTNMRMSLETGNASVLTLPCP